MTPIDTITLSDERGVFKRTFMNYLQTINLLLAWWTFLAI